MRNSRNRFSPLLTAGFRTTCHGADGGFRPAAIRGDSLVGLKAARDRCRVSRNHRRHHRPARAHVVKTSDNLSCEAREQGGPLGPHERPRLAGCGRLRSCGASAGQGVSTDLEGRANGVGGGAPRVSDLGGVQGSPPSAASCPRPGFRLRLSPRAARRPPRLVGPPARESLRLSKADQEAKGVVDRGRVRKRCD